MKNLLGIVYITHINLMVNSSNVTDIQVSH
jgi:hypothetical protein